ncbi:hypothetical protein N0V93_006362 [Gnomoniopsis smithogilvyi]|uniref:Thymidylate kinase n=1 Tax=Gnomoniopsis smithogilvyi TaxID=1191159 RepID=A0A9W8YQM8_9PEZI|nr:hypothetical protein N0V93_006362 [Gnomoniopsis smithogilvyi]
MATIVRQPFAPLDGSRLQSLSGIKNVQNSIPSSVSSPGKRKVADFFDANDFENLDPALLLSKRAKSNPDGLGKDFFKSPTFLLTKSTSVPSLAGKDGVISYSNVKAASPRPRSILNPKSPARKTASSLSQTSSTPMSAPAGRSPPRGNKRISILNRRRAGRIDPPSFDLFAGGFSLDAALKGTVPSYASHASTSSKASSVVADSLSDSGMKSSWFFDIHEDTPEQEMTNLLQHSTCMLDISSDEECEQKMRKERAEGRGKENIPPADDMSQTSTRRSVIGVSEGGMEYEKPRVALGSLNAEDFYAEGVDPTEVIIVPGDDEDGTIVDGEKPQEPQQESSGLRETAPCPEINVKAAVDELEVPKTPVKLPSFQPLAEAGESFDLWESSSAKEEGDNAPSPVPRSPSSEHGDC